TTSVPIDPFMYTVTLTTDSASGTADTKPRTGDLRYCVAQANAAVAQGLGIAPTIQFASNLSGQTITLTQGSLELTSGTGTTTIDGGGVVTVSGGGQCTVFLVDRGTTAVFTGLTITKGQGTGGSTSLSGGGIYNTGTLTLTNDTISGNSATSSGGGIYNRGTLSVSSSTISGNSSTTRSGGGIY